LNHGSAAHHAIQYFILFRQASASGSPALPAAVSNHFIPLSAGAQQFKPLGTSEQPALA
jgi:hypothetical protein